MKSVFARHFEQLLTILSVLRQSEDFFCVKMSWGQYVLKNKFLNKFIRIFFFTNFLYFLFNLSWSSKNGHFELLTLTSKNLNFLKLLNFLSILKSVKYFKILQQKITDFCMYKKNETFIFWTFLVQCASKIFLAL